MPKIPTFTATGSIEQLAGTTSNIKINPNSNIFSALQPVTDFVVKQKIKENDIQNRTEALKLENDYITEANLISEHINQDKTLSINKEAANAYHKEKTNALIEKFAAQATNKNSETMFRNSALGEVQKQIFSINGDISNNILVQADAIYTETKEKIISRAFLKGGIYKETLEQDLENLTIDTFKNRVTYPELQKILKSIPGEIQTYEAIEMVQRTPRKAYYFLKDDKNFPDMDYDKRKKLQDKAAIVIRSQITTEWENYTATVAAGKEPPYFDMKLAVEVMGSYAGEKMLQEESLTKDRVTNNAVINNASIATENEVVQGFIDEGYEMFGETVAAANEKYYRNILSKKQKAMKEDPVDFLIKINPDIEALYEEMKNDDNADSLAATRKIFTEKVIQQQKDMGISNSAIRITKKSEIEEIKKTLTNTDTPYLEKKAFINGLSIIYGKENMSKVLNHLQAENLPEEYVVAISTNSDSLTEDILSGENIEDLKKIVSTRLNSGEKFNSIEKEVAKGMADWEEVILAQGEGSVVKTNYILSVQAAIYKAALQRIKRGDSISDAVDSAVSDFTRDYYIPPSKTWMIPVDVNGVRTNGWLIEEKAEAIFLEVESKDSNYLDKFHGADGYMHYAKFAGIENLTEEQVKDRITSTIRNHSKWLLNADSTGIILNAEFANGTYPIVNANGQKIEFFFTDTPNEQGIFGTELKYPVTGDDISLIEDIDPFGYMDIPIDENQSIDSNNITVGNVDFDFIVNELEGGTQLKGYTLKDFPNSGVTIAGGVDLGARNLNDLKGLPKEIINKLKPYLELKGKNAEEQLKKIPLKLSEKESNILNKFIQKKILTILKKDWKRKTGTSFDSLTTEQATVLASVSFIYGKLETKAPNFWKYVTSNNWQKAYDELMDFKDKSKAVNERHQKAAKLLKKYLDKN